VRTAGDVKFSQTSVGCVQWRYFAGRAADVKSTLPPLKEPAPDNDWPVVGPVVANDQHARTAGLLSVCNRPTWFFADVSGGRRAPRCLACTAFTMTTVTKRGHKCRFSRRPRAVAVTAAAAAASVDVDRGTAGTQVVPRRRGYSSQPKKARPLPRSTRASREEARQRPRKRRRHEEESEEEEEEEESEEEESDEEESEEEEEEEEESEEEEEQQRAVAHANERVDAFARRVGLELPRLIELNRGMPGARGGRLRGSDRLRAGTQLNID
jgi:hypothetical protein